jgi:diguanylate cyclase (GGDEF)-like protein
MQASSAQGLSIGVVEPVGSPARRRLYRSYLIVLCVVFAVTTAATSTDIWSVVATVPTAFWVFASLAVIVDLPFFTLRRPGYPATVSASVSFTFAMTYAWGHGTGRVTQVVAILAGAALSRRAVWSVVFDVGRYGLALSGALLIVALDGQTYPVPPDVAHLGLVLSAAAAWYTVFRVTTATESWLRAGGSWRRALVTGVGGEALTAATLLLLSPLLIAIVEVNAWLIPLVLVPLYAVRTMSRLWYEQSQRALVDPLTGLPNRTAMARATERETARRAADHPEHGHPDGIAALLVVDVDQFLLINEALGSEVADQVLIAVGERLARQSSSTAAIARLKGDEFGLLLTDPSTEDEVLARASAIRAAFAEPITVENQPLIVDASVGIALCPRDGTDFSSLAQRADAAMHDAKELPSGVALYQPAPVPSGSERLALLGELRRVLDQPDSAEIVPYYQPQIELATGDIVGVEALLRWRHPTRGMVSPEEVIRVAERSPVMQQITRRMIDQVLRQLSRWHADGYRVRASVNVSVRDLSGDLVPWLGERLERYGVAPGDLQLEVTESALMTQPGNVLSCLRSLQLLGVGAALDDFGTGFSSLQHLRGLPLTEIKIDRSFVQSMMDSNDAAAIVRSVIDLGGDLGLRVVAEGVDDERTRARLLANRCHVAQGFYYSRALPVDEFDRWLTEQRAAGHRPAEAREAVFGPTRFGPRW